LAIVVGVLIVIQLARIGCKELCFLFFDRIDFNDRVASLIAMVVLTLVIILVAHWRKVPLSVFPERFSMPYVVFTCLFVAFAMSTPIITQDVSFVSIFLLVYAGIVTPIFEETIFRGAVWNSLSNVFEKQWVVSASGWFWVLCASRRRTATRLCYFTER